MRAEDLDTLLGDPWDAANPLSYAAVVAADERHEMLAEGERLLDCFGLNAEFVPVGYGGRFTRADHLADVQRTLWRRDPCLGAAGFGSFAAWASIWASGHGDQRRRAAGLLLDNGRIAAACGEPDQGNDLADAQFTARRSNGKWLLTGGKELVADLRRADAIVLSARTSGPAGRRHSQFLVSRASLPAADVCDLPRLGSSGMRGLQLGGVNLRDWPAPDDTLLGGEGQGVESALRASQITRSVASALPAGPLDTALRAALGFVMERRLYGGTVADIPYVRAVIARVYADLLVIEAFSAVALRALHLSRAAMLYAPAAKYLTSRVALDAFEQLRSVLGAQGYLREGQYSIFQKMARDIASAAFIHISRPACLAAVLPHLPQLARRSWLRDAPAGWQLFDLEAGLPPLDPGQLTVGAPPADSIIGALAEITERGPDGGPAGRFAARFRDELCSLRDRCAALSPRDVTIGAASEACVLADRYTLLLAASAVLAVWDQGGARYGDSELAGVLDRLVGRFGRSPVLTAAERESTEEHLFATAAGRYRERSPSIWPYDQSRVGEDSHD